MELELPRGDELEQHLLVVVVERRVPAQEDEDDDAYAPHVAGLAVGLGPARAPDGDHLRRDVPRRATHVLPRGKEREREQRTMGPAVQEREVGVVHG